MTDKKFNAILDKNIIARQLKAIYHETKQIKNVEVKSLIQSDLRTAITYLKNIEEYIGQANQPSVEDIYQSDYRL